MRARSDVTTTNAHKPCCTRKRPPAFLRQFFHVRPGLILRRRRSYTGVLTPCPNKRSYWVAPKPKDKSGVVYDELTSQDKKKSMLRVSRRSTICCSRMLSVSSRPKTVTTLPRQPPENIIPSNMLDTWKRQDDGTVKAMSRCLSISWKDPMLYLLELAAPTPTQEAIMVTLQWLASAKVSGHVTDLTNAFFDQARKTSRKNKLATKLPSGVTHPAVGPGQLLVETEIYGLVSGPSWVRASLTVDLLAAGYVKNPYDTCVFTLFSNEDTSEGQVWQGTSPQGHG